MRINDVLRRVQYAILCLRHGRVKNILRSYPLKYFSFFA